MADPEPLSPHTLHKLYHDPVQIHGVLPEFAAESPQAISAALSGSAARNAGSLLN